MAKTSSKGSERFELQFTLDGSNWISRGKYDTKAQGIKVIQSASGFLPEGTQFRFVVSEIIPVTAEEIAKVRTRTVTPKAEVSPAEIAPKGSKNRPSADS